MPFLWVLHLNLNSVSGDAIKDVYDEKKDKDGFLYVVYSENESI